MFKEPLDALRADERAVSPVLGVALLIAITVTLVAVIGVVVLGIGPTNSGAPQAKLVFENTSSGVQMSHQGGDELVNSTVSIKVEDNSGSARNISADSLPSEMSAGDTTTVATGADTGDIVKLVWSSQNSDKSQVIATFEVG